MIVIGLMGAKRAGKDYFYSIAEEMFTSKNVMRFAFADALRYEVSEAYGIDIKALSDEHWKEVPLKELALCHCKNKDFVKAMQKEYEFSLDLTEARSPRWIMQRWGTEFRRRQSVTYWIDFFSIAVGKAYATGKEMIIVTDIRFPEEIKIVEDHNGRMIGIRNKQAEANIDIFGHISELLWMHHSHRHDIWNPYPDKNANDFKRDVVALLKEIN